MKLSLFLIAIVAVVSFSSFKEEKSEENNNAAVTNVKGCVFDKNSGETLVGVEVVLEGTNHKTYSDFDGNFVFENIASGEYTILTRIVSYEDVKTKDVNISIENREPVKIEMKQVN